MEKKKGKRKGLKFNESVLNTNLCTKENRLEKKKIGKKKNTYLKLKINPKAPPIKKIRKNKLGSLAMCVGYACA